jgi:hypothetical protein
MARSRLPTDDTIMLAAQLRMAEDAIADEILNDALENRPKNTKKCFTPKQEEFVKWAEAKGYMPPETVTENKVVMFIKERVLGRAYKKNASKIIGKSSVDQYITALTSLWKIQRQQRINSHPTPRGVLVQALRKDLSRKTHETRKQTYFDRGLLYQHLMTNEMRRNRKQVADYFWKNGSGTAIGAFRGMRNRVGYLLSEQGLCRGENIRDLELPDFFCVEMDNEGPTDCMSMVIIKGRGKTNQYGKPLFSGFYRHADVTLCSVSAVAFYFFLRYHICNEPFPSFCKPQDWYDISMFCTHWGNNKKAFSASAHALAITTAHDKLGILDAKVIHGGRVYGRQKLEQSGVEKVAADVAGGWATGAGEGCYGNGLSRPAMRAMSGFPSDDDKVYYLPRASLTPPDGLIQQIFPEVDEWKVRHKEGNNCQKNFALDGYLRLLSWLRIVILQDAAVMMDTYFPSIVFHHPIFSSAEFISYKLALKEQIETQQNPIEQEIQRVLPELCRQIHCNSNSLKDHLLAAIQTSTNKLSHKLQNTENKLQFCVCNLHSAITSCLGNALTTFQHLPAVTTEQLPEENETSSDMIDNFTEININEENTTMPSFEMPSFESVISSSVTTVPEVLMEWEVGLNNRPSVASVESQWKNKWRMGSQNQKMFSRRHLIVNLIQRHAARKRVSNYDAALLIEQQRIQCKYSLRTLAEKWRAFESTNLS